MARGLAEFPFNLGKPGERQPQYSERNNRE